MNDLVILIDCWDTPNVALPQNIISFLDNTESIHTIVLASYNCKQPTHKHWFYKYVELFTTNQSSRKIKDLAHVHSVFNQIDNTYPEERTNPLLLDYVNSRTVQIAMTWLWELEYYLSIHPEIKNIYVLGQAWEMCVKVRPLGYDNLVELPNVNILTNTQCVLDMSGNFLDLTNNADWEHVASTTWKYKL